MPRKYCTSMSFFMLPILALLSPSPGQAKPPTQAVKTPIKSTFDVVVYGGTPGGVTAAISAANHGQSVVLLEQTKHVGGLSTSGLNRDESEHMYREQTFGGLCVDFIKQASAKSGFKKRPGRGPYIWLSHVAEQVFVKMLQNANVQVKYNQLIQRVEKKDGKILSLTTIGGKTFTAKVFVDATYEGDLLAKAGVSYALGRESSDTYHESLGGVIYPDKPVKVSPTDDNGNLLPGVMKAAPPKAGSASPHPTPYNIRLNLTTKKEDQVTIEKPKNYDPKQFELMARSIQAGKIKTIRDVLALYGLPEGKRECNNRQFSIVSMSIPGAQTPWCEATFEQRQQIHQQYQDYTHGILWFLKTDPRVPEKMRKEMGQYGFCKDEWTDNNHWPWYLYVREGRRMKGEYVLTQKDIIEERTKKDSVHLCSHWIDSHQVARYADGKNGFVNEGRLWQRGKIYQFPYRSMVPQKTECKNLLVPVCVSASHVAFCTIRLEPTWMHLGEVAGIAAAMSAKSGQAVQDLSVPKIQEKIKAVGIPIAMPKDDPSDKAPVGRIQEGSAQWVKAFFAKADTDKNGTVSKAEWNNDKDDFEWLFPHIDTNKDGQINVEEYKAFQAYKKKNPAWRKKLMPKVTK